MATVSRSDQTAKVLQIALIITVALLFVLAVVCYFAFSSRADAIALREEAEQKLSESESANTNLSRDNESIRTLLGMGDGETVDEQRAAFNETSGKFEAKPDTYEDLVSVLLGSIADKDAELLQCKGRLNAMNDDLQTAVNEKNRAVTEAQNEVQGEKDRLKTIEDGFNDSRQKFEKLEQELVSAKSRAENRLKQYQAVVSALRLLTPAVQQGLGSQRAEEYTAAEKTPESQIENFIKPLIELQAQVISEKNTVLAALGAADTEVQQFVIQSRPKGDRVDRFDGSVISINDSQRTVEVECRSTLGIRPGMIFRVYADNGQMPLWVDSKATVEVAAVSEGRFVARIRSETTKNLIRVGDNVATPLWSANSQMEFVVVGVVELDGDGKQDHAQLKQIIERAGGRVVDEVRATTTALVDGGQAVVTDSENVSITSEQLKQLKTQYSSADRYGVKTIGLDTFLGWLGIDLEVGRRGGTIDVPGIR